MKSLLLPNPITLSSHNYSPPLLLYHLPTRSFLHVSRVFKRRNQTFLPARASPANAFYGGWDDTRLGSDSLNPGESARDFLVSIGIYNKKHVFTFLFGIITAFAVSRVRVSSIIVFPASVLVFAIGFSFGFFRGGAINEFGANSSEKKVNEETLKFYREKLRSMLGFFDRLDAKVGDLENELQRAIHRKEIGLDDLENFVIVTESMRLLASEAKSAVGTSMESVGRSSSELVENQKSSSGKRKPFGEVGVEFLQFVGGFFGESLVNPKANKVKEKENVKQGRVEGVVGHHSLGEGLHTPSNKCFVNSAGNEIRDSVLRNSRDLGNGYALNWEKDGRIRMDSKGTDVNYVEVDRNAKRFSHREKDSYQNSKLHFADDEYISWKMDEGSETETQISNDRLLDSSNFGVRLRHIETEASFVKRRLFKKSSKVYRSSNSRMMSEDETYRLQSREGRADDDMLLMDDEPSVHDEIGSSSSVISEDVRFDGYLTEANNLLKEAKMCIKGRLNEEHAEFMLYKSAKLLNKATNLKPMSLLAVGQLGNTYLLHGELKLRFSRELRAVLTRKGSISLKIQQRLLKVLDDQVINKDKIASSLVNVCEECEELLVEAGRKYRLALSIDGNDVRALYNWGLALSFRAQLIADIGPEAAFDADKVFMAAIDKFDAMMSKGNAYAPDALFRWGVALQQRSQLRPSKSKERLKLLEQAKRLYEDALHMDAENSQAREALLSCVSQLNHGLH